MKRRWHRSVCEDHLYKKKKENGFEINVYVAGMEGILISEIKRRRGKERRGAEKEEEEWSRRRVGEGGVIEVGLTFA